MAWEHITADQIYADIVSGAKAFLNADMMADRLWKAQCEQRETIEQVVVAR